ncbi:MAG: hypothetical protein V2J62_10265 [candidate division KSB1 bacterium]|jgi:hypothetical protein|nr:hypothetical protein [candidate division KSB1 bacterium]
MKKQVVKKVRESKKKKSVFPLRSENYSIFGIGILIIVLGYVALSRGPADSFWSLTVAPILLIVGYCVVIPLAILYKRKAPKEQMGD